MSSGSRGSGNNGPANNYYFDFSNCARATFASVSCRGLLPFRKRKMSYCIEHQLELALPSSSK